MNLKCSHCSKRFKYESERKRHEESHSPHFECGVCLKKFSFLSALRRHEKQHDRKSCVYCVCGKKFRDETLLKRHVSYAHKGTYNCEKCSASFNSETALQTHMKIHKPESERKFKCTFDGCGKTFNFSHHLKHHILTHTNAKQHYCHICNKGFIQLHHLKAHINTHNPDNWLYCVEPNCKKKFTTEYARKRHQRTHKVKTEHETPSQPNSNSDDSLSSNSMTDIIFNKYSSSNTIHNDVKIPKDLAEQKSRIFNSIVPIQVPVLKQALPTKLDDKTTEPYARNITDCKTVLGGCLMNADTDNNNCLCAQMTECNEVPHDLTLIGNKEVKKHNSDAFSCDPKRTNCEDCECASFCSARNTKTNVSYFNFYNSNHIVPSVEIGVNGAIKIKDTFDIDFGRGLVKPGGLSNDEDTIPYNSCKAILGKCIVSGNGTIGEGCLCMKMKIEEESVTAQEIEDIVPHPNEPALRSIVI